MGAGDLAIRLLTWKLLYSYRWQIRFPWRSSCELPDPDKLTERRIRYMAAGDIWKCCPHIQSWITIRIASITRQFRGVVAHLCYFYVTQFAARTRDSYVSRFLRASRETRTIISLLSARALLLLLPPSPRAIFADERRISNFRHFFRSIPRDGAPLNRDK